MRESETASANWRFFRFKVARFIVIRLRVESCSRSVPFIHRLTGVPVFDADRLLRRVTSWRAISGSGAPAGTGRLTVGETLASRAFRWRGLPVPRRRYRLRSRLHSDKRERWGTPAANLIQPKIIML